MFICAHAYTQRLCLSDICDVTRSHVRRDSFPYATWIIPICDVTHSHMRRDSDISTTCSWYCVKSTQILNKPRTCVNQVTHDTQWVTNSVNESWTLSMSHELCQWVMNSVNESWTLSMSHELWEFGTRWVLCVTWLIQVHVSLSIMCGPQTWLTAQWVTNSESLDYMYLNETRTLVTHDTQWVTNSVLDYMYLHVITIDVCAMTHALQWWRDFSSCATWLRHICDI